MQAGSPHQAASSGNEESFRESESRLLKATKVVANLGVKKHLFEPSGIEIWTVVGNDGDFLIDISPKATIRYCSCSDFHYRVLSGKIEECYHLIAARLALGQGRYTTVVFKDDELGDFLVALLGDLYGRFE